ncbi:hypothetical protein DPEC_G00181290 [Dallia pectoralis]|uniref:Uncharacterized protein n=1 Tax=Dallia pectoralis TaxID=75939 RepID=A0ACC2GAH8_DALPE|nr:hypothetical protein DPEC_G00181290 [Dallia pectoralis]
MFLPLLPVGAVCSSQDGISGSEVELRVRPGDNVTLYCDYRISTETYFIWFRNCSHENQPTLAIQHYVGGSGSGHNVLKPFPGFTLQWNPSNSTYDLLIENLTESDLGLYYCGILEINDKDPDVVLNTSHVATSPPAVATTSLPCGLCWILLFSLCPVSALLSSLLSFSCLYYFWRRTAPTETLVPLNRKTTRGSDRRDMAEENLCYASLDIRQGEKRPTKKTKTVQNSDFSTYSAINTSRV